MCRVLSGQERVLGAALAARRGVKTLFNAKAESEPASAYRALEVLWGRV